MTWLLARSHAHRFSGTAEEDSHLGDFIENKSVVSSAEAVISMNLSEQTRKVLKTLTPREEKVLRMRFGIELVIVRLVRHFDPSRPRLDFEERGMALLRRSGGGKS